MKIRPKVPEAKTFPVSQTPEGIHTGRDNARKRLDHKTSKDKGTMTGTQILGDPLKGIRVNATTPTAIRILGDPLKSTKDNGTPTAIRILGDPHRVSETPTATKIPGDPLKSTKDNGTPKATKIIREPLRVTRLNVSPTAINIPGNPLKTIKIKGSSTIEPPPIRSNKKKSQKKGGIKGRQTMREILETIKCWLLGRGAAMLTNSSNKDAAAATTTTILRTCHKIVLKENNHQNRLHGQSRIGGICDVINSNKKSLHLLTTRGKRNPIDNPPLPHLPQAFRMES